MTTAKTPLSRTAYILALFLLLALPAVASAQWAAPTPGSTDITNTNTTGNVGVGTGTSAPAGRLDVKGSTSDTSATALTVRNSSDTNLFFVRNDGRVGIGTTDPLGFFHVARADAATGVAAFFQKDSSSNGVSIGTNNSKAFISGVNSNVTAMTDLLLNPFGGNIGIGTLTPSARLHVQGGNVFHQYSTTAGQEYGFYTAINNNHFTSNLAYDGQWKMIAAGKGALAYVAPASGFAFAVYADNTPRAVGASATLTQPFTVMMDGSVGIGTTTPTFKLDVSGQVRSSAGGFVFPNGTVQTTAATMTGVTAGTGLTGGGSSGSVTLNVAAGTGITAAAGGVSVNYGSTAGTAVQGNTTLTLAAGDGLSGGGTSTLGTGGTLTLTNNDKGSSQSIFKNVANAAGVTQFSATSNNDTISFEGAGGTTVSFAGKKVTINSSASGQWSNVNSPGAGVYYTGGNVGVGTSTPLLGLTGNGGMEVFASQAIATLRVGTGLAGKNNAQVRFSGASGDNWAIGSDVATHSGSRDFHLYDFAGTPGARLTIQSATGAVGIGTMTPAAGYKLDVNGDAHVTGAVSTTGAISAGGAITGATINATYQDVAEWVPSTQKLEAGTVVVLDGDRTNHVLASTSSYDTKVAGVVSERPGIALGEGGDGKALVATTGRVRVRVDATRAPIRVGDLLVTSDVEGVAMKSEPIEIGGRKIHAPGTIIGKALEPLSSGTGEILVLLSLQ